MVTALFWTLFFLLGGVKLYSLFVKTGLAVLRENGEKGTATARPALSSTLTRGESAAEKPWHLYDAALMGRQLSFVLGVTAVTFFFMTYVPWGGEVWAVLTSVVVMVFLGDFLPRVLATTSNGEKSRISLYPLWMVAVLFRPVLWIGDMFRAWLGKEEGEKRSLFCTWLQEEDLLLAPGIQEESWDVEERRIIDKISTLGEVTVREAMVPLVRIVAMEETATVKEVTRKIQEYGYSRIPIYRERIYNIIGVVNAFDILLLSPEVEEIDSIIRPAYYVPDAKRVDSLLQDMQRQGIQMAVVVDEYGGSMGIITIEDLLEEIVGEIEDEYDFVRRLYEELPDGGYLFDARMEIDAINEKLNLHIRKGDYETLGGFVITLLERIPKPGEEFEYDNLLFRIESATDRGIQKIRVQPKKT